jgi:hypothetical protein
MSKKLICFFIALIILAVVVLHADEGMYPPNSLPLDVLKAKYGFVPDQAWLNLVQRGAVRFPDGSGSFVSSNGLVFTNHHIAFGCAQAISTEKDNIVANGFVARGQREERKCPNLELNALQSIADVTDRLKSESKNAVISSESARTGLKCEVVALWHGARFHAYCYKQYTDVRMVFFPETDAAQFGGDPDNFEFPRFGLDIAFMRAYENGKPASTPIHFKWSGEKLAENTLLFTSGHPGRTDRGQTLSTLKYFRDAAYPKILDLLRRYEIALQQYSFKGREQARVAKEELFSVQNSRKAYVGMLQKLQDPAFMQEKEKQELALRSLVAKDPSLQNLYGSAWDDIARANRMLFEKYNEWRFLGMGTAFYSKLFGIAQGITQLAAERAKPESQRAAGYSDAEIPAIVDEILTSAPIDEGLEEVMLSESLSMAAEALGGDNASVAIMLGGKTPKERAHELVSGTRLKNLDARKLFLEKGLSAAKDPMTDLAVKMAKVSEPWVQYYQKAQTAKTKAYAKIYEASNRVYGTAGYPDATFTLRISFGTALGYEENGVRIPFQTTFAGLYARASEHDNTWPWKLTPRWERARHKLNLSVPFDFVSTNDITGGNSGSPVLNAKGEIVGIIFDGNTQSLGNDLSYSERQARAVSVSATGIVEALKKVYNAQYVLRELGK